MKCLLSLLSFPFLSLFRSFHFELLSLFNADKRDFNSGTSCLFMTKVVRGRERDSVVKLICRLCCSCWNFFFSSFWFWSKRREKRRKLDEEASRRKKEWRGDDAASLYPFFSPWRDWLFIHFPPLATLHHQQQSHRQLQKKYKPCLSVVSLAIALVRFISQ